MHDVVGWVCRVCGTAVELSEPFPWRCPRSTSSDRHHVLRAVSRPSGTPHDPDLDPGARGDANPFVVYDSRSAWAAAAAARGMTADARRALVDELDAAIRRVDGAGFVVTPFGRNALLSTELGFAADGGVWVKDETGGVGGSQKSRHLFSILLHLRALEATGELVTRPRLAIASCGNAALAAATLASAAEWPIDVFVPTWMGSGFGDRLDELGAIVHRCPRSPDDPPGDPAMLRFREAVEAGAVPFTVQGPENALCLDGGRTIGWEIADQVAGPGGPGELDAVFVQVGGGALATSLGAGLAEGGVASRLVAVQTAGCAPFDRAWRRICQAGEPAAAHWADLMTPWRSPESLADGILDDETYDWLGVVDAIEASAGDSVVASEVNVVAAHALAHRAGCDASPTGTAGLAGLLEVGGARSGWCAPATRIAVVMSGVTR